MVYVENTPDIVLVDGNGILHPQGFGLASHFGVIMNIITIGVGKTFLHVDGLNKPYVRHLMDRAIEQGDDVAPITGQSGKVWGVALCGTSNVKNPVFVSIGHQVSLKSAVAIVRACSRYRIPEPIRQADKRSRKVIHEWEENKGKVDTTLDRFTIKRSI